MPYAPNESRYEDIPYLRSKRIDAAAHFIGHLAEFRRGERTFTSPSQLIVLDTPAYRSL
jgi:hypothetical protein